MLVEKDFATIPENAARLIGSDWMLIGAGAGKAFNMMTASWGGLGNLWHRPVSFIFVRPQRYTYSFIEKNEYFSICFFDEKYREALNFSGTVSGKNVDKAAETGLTPIDFEDKTIYFEQARLVLICRKLYHQDIKPELFDDAVIDSFYPAKDYHRMYIGEIVHTLAEQESNF